MELEKNRQTEIVEPYKLPDGWKWTRLGDFIDTYRGVSYKKTDVHSERLENDCLIMRGGNIDEGKINTETDNVYVDKSLVSQNQFVQKNDVIIVTSTGSTKVIGRAGISYQNYSDVAFGAFLTLARPNGKAEKAFVNQYFQSPLYRERIRQLASGVNINNIRLEYITESPFPLPPTLAEQQRIVNRIETMFAKLDQAQEKAQNIVDSFETRKAAILHKAFTGQLRIDNEELKIEDWEVRELDVDFDIVSGIQKTPSRVPKNKPVPYLTVANVFRDRIDLSEVRYFEVSEAEVEKLKLIEKDILVVEGNGSGNEIGRCAMWRNEIPVCVHQNHIIRLRKKTDSVLPEYVLLYLNSSEGKEIMKEKAKTTAGLYNLSAGKIKTISVPYPPLNYQLSIVNFLDSVLEKESRAKEAAQTVLEQIALLKKSILARAFRGEL